MTRAGSSAHHPTSAPTTRNELAAMLQMMTSAATTAPSFAVG
jgi:hypothetical protein